MGLGWGAAPRSRPAESGELMAGMQDAARGLLHQGPAEPLRPPSCPEHQPRVQSTVRGWGRTALGVGQEMGDLLHHQCRGAVERARTARADSKLPLRESGEKEKESRAHGEEPHVCSPGTDGQQHRAYPEHRGTPGTTQTPSHHSCAKSERPPRVTSPLERARRGRAEGHGSSCHRYKLQPHQRAAARGCAAPEPPPGAKTLTHTWLPAQR